MKWIVQGELIYSGNRLVGSMVYFHDVQKWRVEILWTGLTGDIKFETVSSAVAIGFIEGVEKAFKATNFTEREFNQRW